jgi:hypothetical protein
MARELWQAAYAQQSCTAGRAAFIMGPSPIRTGLTKVGLPPRHVRSSACDYPPASTISAGAHSRCRYSVFRSN